MTRIFTKNNDMEKVGNGKSGEFPSAQSEQCLSLRDFLPLKDVPPRILAEKAPRAEGAARRRKWRS